MNTNQTFGSRVATTWHCREFSAVARHGVAGQGEAGDGTALPSSNFTTNTHMYAHTHTLSSLENKGNHFTVWRDSTRRMKSHPLHRR